MSLRLIVIVCLILGVLPVVGAPPSSASKEFTLDDILTAYEAGQFRVIHTRANSLAVSSSDGRYISARGDGIYRVADGAYFDYFDAASFSPDGQYVIQNYDGIYRLSDRVKVVDAPNNATSQIRFSDNGAYVSVAEVGVYRLSDGQQIVVTDNSAIFSADSSMVAVTGGVFRLSDGQKLLETGGSAPAHFSLDDAYVWSDAVYRLSDGQRLFDVNSPHGVWFTPDMTYAVIPENGVYRLRDGERLYALDQYIPYLAGFPILSANSEYMAIHYMGVYRIRDGAQVLDFPDYEAGADFLDMTFNRDSTLIAISKDGVYRLSDGHRLFEIGYSQLAYNYFSSDRQYLAADGIYRLADGQRLFDIGWSYAIFSPSNTYVALPHDGVYRLSDQHRLFEIAGSVRDFSPDEAYLHVGYVTDVGVYRLRDGYQYRGLRILHVAAGIMAIGNTVIVIDPAQNNQALPVICTTMFRTSLYPSPAREGQERGIRLAGNYLVVLAAGSGWYLVNYEGELGWVPADEVEFFHVPE